MQCVAHCGQRSALSGYENDWIALESEFVAGGRSRSGDPSTTAKRAGRVETFGRLPVGAYLRERTTNPDEAEEIISKHYLPNRLYLPRGRRRWTWISTGLQIGVITAGRLSYGHQVRQMTEEAHNFHVNVPMRGHAALQARAEQVGGDRCGSGPGLLSRSARGDHLVSGLRATLPDDPAGWAGSRARTTTRALGPFTVAL